MEQRGFQSLQGNLSGGNGRHDLSSFHDVQRPVHRAAQAPLGTGNHAQTAGNPLLPEEPGFVVIQGDPSDEGALRVVSELHDYYQFKRDQLVAAYEQQLRYQAAAQAWEKAHPPQPENVTIRVWNMSADQAESLKGEAQP